MADGTGRRVLVTADDRLRLVEVPGDVPVFAVEQIDETAAGVVLSEGPEFGAAAHDFNVRVLDSSEIGELQAMDLALQMATAMGVRDLDRVASLLADDFVMVDHRGIGYPQLDRAGMIEATALNAGTRSVYTIMELHAASPSAWAGTGCFWTDEFGEWSPFELGVWVGAVRDGKLVHVELFPEDRRDDAMECFARLAAADGDPDAV